MALSKLHINGSLLGESAVDIPSKFPVMRKTVLCYDVIMTSTSYRVYIWTTPCLFVHTRIADSNIDTLAISGTILLSVYLAIVTAYESIPGALHTKTYDVMTLRYHKSSKLSHFVKYIFCGVWVQTFVWNFKGHLWHFTRNFEPMHCEICISLGFIYVCDLLYLWIVTS